MAMDIRHLIEELQSRINKAQRAADGYMRVSDSQGCSQMQARANAFTEALQLLQKYMPLLFEGADWCDVCNAPQMVTGDGVHHCGETHD